MCGIAGLRLYGKQVRRQDIERMNTTLVHRGPDEEGIFVNGSTGLGIRRLSIIDLEGGQQPISNENGRIHVVQNGEIYNYRELREELRSRGHVFRTRSDTEVIVHAYEEWGGFAFAARLRGMFAIAVWDAQRRELWLVRDRIGIKPLYYSAGPDGFAFGSEVKALLASPVVDRELEVRTLGEYLQYGTSGWEDSFVKNVRQLRPGRVLRLVDRRVEVRPYWEFRFPRRAMEISEQEATEALRDRLRDTVRLHLVSDVPVGAFLSGGVDSSAVVGMMAQEAGGSFKTFSIGFAEDDFNELPRAQQVADKWHTDHHTEIVRPEDAIGILDTLIYHLDEPFADASAIPTWYVSRLAAERVKVVLSGDGGDELFAGYTRYARAVDGAWIDRIPFAARKLGSLLSGFLPERFPGKYFLDYAARDARSRYMYERDLFPPPLRRRLLRAEWRPECLAERDAGPESLRMLNGSGARDPLSEYMYLDTLRYLPLDILVKVDRMTMAHGLEARPPLLDHEFVEFAASLPTSLKYAPNGRRKHVLKNSVASLVPSGLLDQRKSGFSVPLQQWFAGPLVPLLEDLVFTNGRCTKYLDPQVIRMLLNENRRRRRNHGLQLWAILMLELWLRQVLEAG